MIARSGDADGMSSAFWGGGGGTGGSALGDARDERDGLVQTRAGRARRERARNELEDGVTERNLLHGDGAHADLEVA